MSRNQLHFEKYREWQWIKHMILGDYLVPWSAKVGSTASEIYVVDAFAGAGSYVDVATGSRADGSPVIELRRAQEYVKKRPDKTMQVICVEKDAQNFAKLAKRIANFTPAPILLKGALQKHVHTIGEIVGDAPTLLLLDPIGVKAIDYETCAPLLGRTGKTDVFITIDFQVIHRTAGQLQPDGTPRPQTAPAAANARNVDAFFGTHDWVSIAFDPVLRTRQERQEAYLDLYFDRVLGSRYGYKCAYEVRARWGGALRYWIVQASDNRDAFWLMNDQIAKVDGELYLRQQRDGELPGIIEQCNRNRVASIETDLRSAVETFVLAKGSGGATVEHIKRSLVGKYFGRTSEGAYSRAIKALIRSGSLERENPRAAAKLTNDEVIRPAAGSA
jgi:three-Cys-motif partner protein